MTKVSSNAGKHPYQRTDGDYAHQFDHIRNHERGIEFNHTIKPKFNSKVETEFKDKEGKRILFKDLLIFKKEEYVVGYNSKEFFWNIENTTDPKKMHKLSEIAHLTILQKRGNKI
jgi:hypothetical protein